ncbi:hypothetical protein DCCM_0527 [Desulfocucumis palustris]|uniref:Uncharacterized protein n=1 Tax=Desulfocucumis palustris TaxID=1898651 RepID=A0A2L2X9Q5_9FIRM|nr:hypothetical protein DCCM_0527 [Desulfocucumis palustris]
MAVPGRRFKTTSVLLPFIYRIYINICATILKIDFIAPALVSAEFLQSLRAFDKHQPCIILAQPGWYRL